MTHVDPSVRDGPPTQCQLPTIWEFWNLPSSALSRTDDLDRLMLVGGMPLFLLADRQQPRSYTDRIDDFWAKDVTELFRVHLKPSFNRFIGLLLARQGRSRS